MLKVVNLTKIYKTKNGADVHALDGVTLQFPETGMVFLLGKSGSGKSTLLNVCGGLDNPTGGEIIVKGRSSKDFSQSDFDSYRNTFIGFIFQEYNILNEFSVEDNIALALELQGKPKDKKAISALLEEVDLQGYAKRKPNTLSGGQKQRIAIARALIKSPEIIMADEPTGALDSNTGRQVLETLKKLSAKKLVIVVSHDREFAEQYGDRIIELKDGKVISDISKGTLSQTAVSDNLSTVGDVLCIKNGSDLTDSDFEKIKAFLKKSERDIVIAKDEKDVKTFKKANRINDDGQKEVFLDTDSDALPKKEYTKEESRFIRSKLPIRHAVKIGASGLRLKPLRLFFTIILCTVAFTLLGLLSTLNFYNSEATFKETLSDLHIANVQLRKDYATKHIWYHNGEKEGEYEGYNQGHFSADELNEISNRLGSDVFGAAENMGGNFNLRNNSSRYWVNRIRAYAFLPQTHPLRQSINGKYPENNNQIVITSYIADMFMQCQAMDTDGNLIEVTDPSQFIGKKINIQGEAYEITGILDSGAVSPEFDELKNGDTDNNTLVYKLETYMQDTLHCMVFTTEDRITQFASQNYYKQESITDYTRVVAALQLNGTCTYPEWPNTNYKRLSDLTSGETVYTPDGTARGDDQAFVSTSFFAQAVQDAYWRLIEEAEKSENYTLSEYYRKTTDLANQIMNGGIYSWNEEDKTDNFTPFTQEQLESKIAEVFAAAKKDNVSLTIGMKFFDERNQTPTGDEYLFPITGVVCKPTTNQYIGENLIVFSENTFNRLWDVQKTYIEYYGDTETSYVPPENDVYSTAVVSFVYSEAAVQEYWNIYSNKDFDEKSTRIAISSNFIGNLQMADDMVESLSTAFLYIGLAFAVFAALLLSNFISVSISYKKREIGILRAVGARSADVFKIFFSESSVITIICIVLSTVASFFVCGLINSSLAEYIGASVFVFGTLSFAILVGVAVVTAIVATFLPVYNAAKKKPVDSIRAL